MTVNASTASKTVDRSDSISMPLYISGLVVTWTGIAAVNSQIAADPFTTTTVALVLLGFVFSLAARWAKIDARIINSIPVVILLYFGVRYLRHSFSLSSMAPIEAQQSGDMAIAVALAWVSVVRSWMLITDSTVVFSAVTSIAMIGLVGAFNVNTDLVAYFCIYVIAALYLVIHQNYLVHRTWLGGKANFSTDLNVLRTHLALCAVLGVTAILIGTVLLVPVKMLGSHLSLAAAVRFYYNPGSADISRANVEFSDDPKFEVGGGDGYTSNDTVVMIADPDDGQQHYWRGRSYDQYTRHGWVSTLDQPQETLDPLPIERDGEDKIGYEIRQDPSIEGPNQTASSGTVPNGSEGRLATNRADTLITHLTIVGGRTSTLYSPSDPDEIVVSRPLNFDIHESRDGAIGFDSVEDRLEYWVESRPMDPSINLLRKASLSQCPRSICVRYVLPKGQGTLTESEQQRLSATARSIVAAQPPVRRDPFETAMAIQHWVGRRCLYDLSVGPVPDNEDAVSYFLFTSRRGYCDLFASSMALLCRYAGIPSRVVTGFAPGIPNDKGGYNIRARDKHAWVEVYLSGVGWYPMDPTIDATAADNHAASHDMLYYFREMANAISRYFNLNGPIPLILFGVIVIGLSYVVKTEVVDRLRARWRLAHRIQSLESTIEASGYDAAALEAARQLAKDRYRRMERAMSRIGIPRARQMTPDVFAGIVMERLAALPPTGLDVSTESLIESVACLSEDLVAASYAPPELAVQLLDAGRQQRADSALAVMDRVARKFWYKGRTKTDQRLAGPVDRV